jgi:predicted ATPase
MAQYAELELSLERQSADSFAVELRFSLPDNDADLKGKAEGHRFAIDELRQLVHDPAAYGRRLGHDLFQVPHVRESFAVVKSRGLDLRFRLSLAPTDQDLHGLRWETLADPDAPSPGAPLLMSERVLFSRYVDSSDWRQVTPRAKGDLRALVVIANPSDLARYRLAPVDVPGEIRRARAGMTGIATIDVLGERERASMMNIVEQLRTGPDILYLVCHGALVDGTSALWLEQEDGTADRRGGQEVVSWLGELKQPPRLVVLVSCQGAGTGEGNAPGADVTAQEEAWTALGPRLGASGVPAVLAMQGNVSMTTVEAFMPVFFHELQRDGQIDRAVSLARGAVRARHDAWAPVLYMRLKSGRLWSERAPTEMPPRPSQEQPSHTLPAQPTPLLGRDAELASLHERLTTSEARLITLTGPGGIGKTRLAVQAALDAVAAFPDGVWWVPLAAITDPVLVVQTIASAVGVGEVPGAPLLETLAEHLRSRHLLLLLDNLEQVIAAAPLIARLLETAPALRVLATSRAPLRVRAEQEVPVAPLVLPPERPGTVSLATAQASTAVQLFVARAQAVKPGFALDESTAPTVATICRRLDGLPLAIELAAARIRILPPEQLLGRLDERLQLLTGGSRDLPARQQTLRATIAWSHGLLTPDEQILFARLAAFAGGCTYEAAEAVCAAAGELSVVVLDGLEALVEQSLLRQGDGADGEPRFTMLETIREYGLEQLAALPDAETVWWAHAEFFLKLAEEAKQYLAGPEQVVWLDRLGAEHDNFRAALGWLEHAINREPQLRLAVALWRYWWLRGHLTEGRGRLDRALTNTADLPLAIQAEAHRGAGILAESQGDYERATRLHEEALSGVSQLGDRPGIASSLTDLGIIARFQGDYGRATQLQEQALSIWRELNDEAGMTSSLYELGRLDLQRGDYMAADELLNQSLVLARASGDASALGPVLESLGTLAFYQEDYRRAAAWYEESLAVAREVGDALMIAHALTALGEAVHYQDDLARAEELYQEALALHHELGETLGTALALDQLGKVALARNDTMTASTLLTESLVLRRDVGDKSAVIESLEALAELAGLRGDTARGVLLFGASEALRLTLGAPLPPSYTAERERALAAARAVLSDADFAAAWNRGQTLSLQQAIAEALTLHHAPVKSTITTGQGSTHA